MTKQNKGKRALGRMATVHGLRVTDQETARVVAVNNKSGRIMGAGCLVTGVEILTCYHVVESALDAPPEIGSLLYVKLVGVSGQPTVEVRVRALGDKNQPFTDVALVEMTRNLKLAIAPVEFATPLRHSGKRFSVLGFPDGDPQGRNASGFMHAADATGLVQMDGGSSLEVKRGFSGAPVWSPDLGAFVGIVVTELSEARVAWCIPSRLLCAFYNDLLVRFRMPPSDRPRINDYAEDDPNPQIFGTASNNGHRMLTASITWDDDDEVYIAKAKYKRLKGSPNARGGYVTFITHPSLSSRKEDAYELFARISSKGEAKVEFYPAESFTIAAVGDGGDTTLTLDMATVPDKPDHFE